MSWRDVLRRKQAERDLTKKVEAHIELQARKHLAAGDPRPMVPLAYSGLCLSGHAAHT